MSATDPTMDPTLSKRIALDMDDVMADTLTAWLERYNQDFGTRITKADLHGKRIYDFVGPSQAVAARAYLDHPNSFPAKYVWLKKHFLSYRTKTLCSAGTKASSGQTS